MISFVPFSEVSPVCHVGTMDISRKGDFSLEWNGLSVSYCPNEWKYIAGCHGDTWVLEDPSGQARFLDFYALEEADLAEIRSWGVGRGLFEYGRQFRVHYYDSEYECERWLVFGDDEEEAARDEYEFKLEEEYDGVSLEELEGQVKPTEALIEMSLVKPDPALGDDIAVMLYAEEELGCEGVWWDEELAPYALSAPRGVVFNSCLDRLPARLWDDELDG